MIMEGSAVAPLMTNGLASNGADTVSEKSERKKHKKEKKHKEHKEHKQHKHKKDKKEKHKDKHREKDGKKKSKHKDKHGSSQSYAVTSDTDHVKPLSPTKIKTENEQANGGSQSMMISETVATKVEPLASDDDMPLASARKRPTASDDDEDFQPLAKKAKKKAVTKAPVSSKTSKTSSKAKDKHAKKEPVSVGSNKKKSKRELAREQETAEVWKWWEEDRKDDGRKWTTLEHQGLYFTDPYDPLPPSVKFKYNGKDLRLSTEAEEVASFYAKMLTHDYTSNDVFNTNFFKDWRKMMNSDERKLITDLQKCDFTKMHVHFTAEAEARKNRSKEEKKALKEQNDALIEKFGYCAIDGHKERIGNFRVEPPGLFRGRGQHPKMGMLKKRVQPEDIIINCSKGKAPTPPSGHKWKEIRHDNTVTWLACWTENIQNQTKYVMLNPASRLKGEKDWLKYEKARNLHKIVDKVRANYQLDLKSKVMATRQRAVALYFIDKLALRAGNEKDADEQADTVGCCSLRVEHITLHDQKDGLENVVEFDFLGKDSIRYQNSVSVDKKVYKNVRLFMEGKAPSDDLFDRLTTSNLNKHLQDIMEGLTAKVFRTYNASRTLEEQLNLLTKDDDNVAAKMLSYNRANRAVAVLCNHQRAVPKNFSQQMDRLNEKIKAKKLELKEVTKAYKEAKGSRKGGVKSTANAVLAEKKKKAVDRITEQLHKLEVQATDKDENKDIALGTSKLNYLDPRISVAWLKKHDVPIEKVYNKTQRQKFMWAVDMAGPDFVFCE